MLFTLAHPEDAADSSSGFQKCVRLRVWACSASALAVDALFPGVLPIWAWAVLHGIFGFLVVGIGRYGLFEQVIEVFVGLMFVTVVGLAILLTSNLGDLAIGLVPRIPDGSLLYALGIIGWVKGDPGLFDAPAITSLPNLKVSGRILCSEKTKPWVATFGGR